MTKTKVSTAAPLFVLAVYILLLAVKLIKTDGFSGEAELFLVVTVMQLAVFALPSFMWCRPRGQAYLSQTGIRGFPLRQLPVVIGVFFVAVFGAFTLNSLIYAIGIGSSAYDAGTSYILSGITTNSNPVFVVVTFAAIPALCEEFLFRGIVMTEYRVYGNKCALVMSALLFAMSHFSLSGFPAFFLTGLLFGYAALFTDSILAPIVMHFFGNLFSIYVLPVIWNLITQPMGLLFALFIVLVVFFISLIIALKLIADAYYKDAVTPRGEIVQKPAPSAKKARPLLKALTTPAFLICVAVYIAAVIVRIFV